MSPMSRSGVSRRGLLRLMGGAAGAAAVMGASGCGLLGGSKGAEEGGNGGVEKSRLRVGALPTSEIAPLHLAAQNGHFQREGLQVDIVTASDGAAALNSTIGGDYDITFSSYVPIFQAQSKGIAQLKIVADCAAAAPNTCVIMASPASGVRRPADLAGRKIAISGPGTISELMVKAAMRANGVDFGGVSWAPLGFVNMPAALQQGQVDAAFLVEPFLTLAARDARALPVVDTATGPLANLPLGGYVSTAAFADANPKTVAAFQRAMDSAVTEAQDRTKIEPLLTQFAKIDRETASIISLLQMNSRPDASRLQRVPRLMKDFGYLDKDIDVASMIVPPRS